MARASLKSRVASLLTDCGIKIGGDAPWDIHVHDEDFYARVIAHGSLGLGETYMDEQWDATELDAFLFRLLNAHVDQRTGQLDDARLWIKAELLNLQRGRRAYEIGEHHYDLGNDLFRAMLGKRLVYSCGYWNSAQSLDAAQADKLDLVCRKLWPVSRACAYSISAVAGGGLETAPLNATV